MIFYGNLTQAEVAKVYNTSMFHVHVAHYDCSCATQQEAAMGGAILFGLGHPLNTERPVIQWKTIEELAAAIAHTYENSDLEAESEKISNYALKRWSYEAFFKQYDRILKEV